MLYKDLPEPLQRLCCIRAQEQGKLRRITEQKDKLCVGSFFTWKDTKEGAKFWQDLDILNSPNLIPEEKIQYARSIVGDDVPQQFSVFN